MVTKTKRMTANEHATRPADEAAELSRLVDRLTDAAARIDWGARVPDPSSPAAMKARDRLAGLGEKLSDARRRADALRNEITDAERRARDLDAQAAAVADGADPAEATKSLRAKRDELADAEHSIRVLERAITREREALRRAIVAESPAAAAAVRPTFDAAVETLCLAIRVCQQLDPLLGRLLNDFQAAGYVLGDRGLPNVAVPYELRGEQVEETPTGTVRNPTMSAVFLDHARAQGFDV